MEYITKEDFEAWMERILDKFDRSDEKLNKVLSSRITLNGEELLDNQNLIELLKVSHRTLQRYRSDGKLPYCHRKGKVCYKVADVHKFIREYFEGK